MSVIKNGDSDRLDDKCNDQEETDQILSKKADDRVLHNESSSDPQKVNSNQDQLRAALIPSFWLTQLLLLVPGGALLWFFYLRKGYNLQDFFAGDNLVGIWLLGTFVALFGIAVQFIAWKIFTVDAFDDGGVNRLLLELPAKTLFSMFMIGAFSEELLVRGVVQTGIGAYLGPVQGVLVTSILFTAMHIRYLKKPVLMSGVFLLSLILCALYSYTSTLWATVYTHFLYNFGAAILAKKYYLPLISDSKESKAM